MTTIFYTIFFVITLDVYNFLYGHKSKGCLTFKHYCDVFKMPLYQKVFLFKVLVVYTIIIIFKTIF